MNSRPRKYVIMPFSEVPGGMVFRYVRGWFYKLPNHANLARDSVTQCCECIPLDKKVGIKYSDYHLHLKKKKKQAFDPDAQSYS